MDSPASMGETVPLGYRFKPTDEELVGHYLKYKLLGYDSRVQNVIAEVDVCKFEPWDLPALSKVKSEDPEWFFFSPRDLKYANSDRSNRLTNAGYWKATGKDRKIKTRDTNNVIGTKKTLVFHRGRVPHGVKTNWVIHEYRAVTFPVDKRTFVLCRLMKKAEKKVEGRTDELINEAEPIVADHENQATDDGIPDVFTLPEVTLESIFLAPPQADEYDFPSLQYSPIVTDHEPFHTNICFENENSIRQFPFDTTEDEDNILFLNSVLVDEDVFINEERRDAFVNESIHSESLRGVYYKSSETDAELVSVRGTTSACNKHAVSSGCQVLKIVKTSPDAGHLPLSSKTEVNREKKDSTFGDNFWGGDSSGDSTSNEPLSMLVTENIISPSAPTASFSSTSRRCKTKYQARSNNSESQKAAPGRSQTHRKVSSKAVYHRHEVQKETDKLESNKDQNKAQDARSRMNLETTSDQSPVANRKGSFIYLQTPSISQNPNPRSVYLINVIIGFSLLIFTIWDMLSIGNLC
ncbi:NAC domain-containing protein 69-like [Gastrolobium bilobum]|uniref:NAC domain-containing protein 69-like n=1 Tax=Gastrolobium bilobum TaxID=150636 RepID=UPI002AB1F31B|nr:NAC domain-containing protein 69-like [Gastrolobium bilobum]